MKNLQDKNFIKRLLEKPVGSSEVYHQKSKIKKLNFMELDFDKWPKSWTTVFFKDYHRMDKVVLPPPTALGNTLLEDVLRTRSSSREFSQNPMSLEQISTLLYYSAGLRDNNPPHQGKRFYPSGGARYPLEVYLISQNSELAKGVYHYNLRSHSLETLLLLDEFKADDYFNQEWIEKASLIIVITACFERNTVKYGERGYRHILMEAGHLGQNIWLNSTAIKILCCGVGGYVDDKLNKLLDVDGFKESVIYVICVGTKKK